MTSNNRFVDSPDDWSLVEVIQPLASVLKYSEDQPRDADGRFGSGGGSSSTPKPVDLNNREAVLALSNFQREQGFTAENNSPVWDMAITAYTDGSGEYSNINGYLREGEMYFDGFPNAGTAMTVTEGNIANLDNLIAAAPPLEQDLVSFRGISGEDAVYEFSNLEAGDQFTDAGFVSTSLDPQIAENFTQGDGITLQIISPAGTQGLMPLAYQTPVNASTPDREKEWLLPRGVTFDVLAVSDNLITVRVNNEVPRG